ncbi:MAG TPA: hypothetical protein VG779_03070 [Actinomycetota bacterium]|nr:hypothetical protein [Actinomycetota bacterium]
MSRGRRRRGGAHRPAAGEGASSAATPGTESPSPQAGTRKGGSRQKQTPQGGRQQAVTPPGTEGARRSGGRRRRRRSGASRAEPSVLEQMVNRPRVLQTLPADGLVAEEIIGDMREEYGYPATPQEYRLIVRVAPDEAERQSPRRRREPSALPEGPAEATDEEAVDGDEASDAPKEATPTVRRGRLRRRRRGRGRSGGAGRADGAGPDLAGPRGDLPGDPARDSGLEPSPDSPGGLPGDSPGAAPGGDEPAAD